MAPVVVMVRVEDPVPVMEVGAKLAEAPEGRPETASAMVPVKPFSAVLLTVYAVLEPAKTDCVAGVAATE